MRAEQFIGIKPIKQLFKVVSNQREMMNWKKYNTHQRSYFDRDVFRIAITIIFDNISSEIFHYYGIIKVAAHIMLCREFNMWLNYYKLRNVSNKKPNIHARVVNYFELFLIV